MKKKFVLEIEMGNDEMLMAPHVAKALGEVAMSLTRAAPLEGKIYDSNGNKVGTWKFTGIRR